MTSYSQNEYKSPIHRHENPHIGFPLEGGREEKRLHRSFEGIPGDVLFCQEGEPHQFITKKFPSKNINVEIDFEFLTYNSIWEEIVGNVLTRSPDTKFLMLKCSGSFYL